MKLPHKHLILSSLLAAASLAALAQSQAPAAATPATPAASAAQPGDWRMHRGDPAEYQQRRQARHAERLAALKTQLKLTPAQEGAWTNFSKAMEPAPRPATRPDRAEWAKLTTPERIDRMQVLRKEHNARQDQRAQATKTFYASLTAEQKKVFDAETLRDGHRHGPWGDGHGMKEHRRR